MEYYAGIDVSLKEGSVCVVDVSGKVVREVKVASEPEALVRYFDELGLPVSRAMVRTALFEAAHTMLTRAVRFSSLKRWALDVAKRRGMKRAKVALARKLGVVLHRMWVDAIEFRWSNAVPAA